MTGDAQPRREQWSKRALARCSRALLGRRNLVRLGRFLLNQGRLDVGNQIGSNGEELVQERLLAAAPPGRLVVLDVGAYRGWWTESLLRVAERQGRELEVHLFEASSESHARLLETIESWGSRSRLELHRLGVSDREGEAEFYVSPGGGSDSVYAASMDRAYTAERIRFTTVDRYCEERGLDSLLFLKSDVEGHDLKVLQGAAHMLESRRIQALQFEYNHRWIPARCFLRDAFDLLQGFGYELGKITPRGIEFYRAWDFELETFHESNYLACLPEWKERFPRVRWWKEADSS